MARKARKVSRPISIRISRRCWSAWKRARSPGRWPGCARSSRATALPSARLKRRCSMRSHRIFKLKIGLREVRDDVAHVLAIKRALGERASVRVDVNQAWSEMDAVRGIAALEAGGVDLIERS